MVSRHKSTGIAAWMAGIVADVFGQETGSRALNVFATQGSWPGLEEFALRKARERGAGEGQG